MEKAWLPTAAVQEKAWVQLDQTHKNGENRT